MSKVRDDEVRLTVLVTLDAVQVALVSMPEVFAEVARGRSLDPQQAENLGALCRKLLLTIAETRAAVQLSADSPGVH